MSTCEVCTESYNVDDPKLVPKILPCGHTFCSACLECLILGDSIKCPRCRRDARGIKTLKDVPRNFALIDSSSQEHPKCKQHRESLNIFCNVDRVLICYICSIEGSHVGHDVAILTDASVTFKATLKKVIKCLESRGSELTKFETDIGERTAAVTRNCDRSKVEIHDKFDEIIQSLNARKRLLSEQVEHHQKAEEKLLEDLKSKIEHSKSEVTACRKKVDAVLEEKSDILLVNEYLRVGASIGAKLSNSQQLRVKMRSLKTGVNVEVQFDDIAKGLLSYGAVITRNSRNERVSEPDSHSQQESPLYGELEALEKSLQQFNAKDHPFMIKKTQKEIVEKQKQIDDFERHQRADKRRKKQVHPASQHQDQSPSNPHQVQSKPHAQPEDASTPSKKLKLLSTAEIKNLEKDAYVDHRDNFGKWLQAQIEKVDVQDGVLRRVFIHYLQWPRNYDTWIDIKHAERWFAEFGCNSVGIDSGVKNPYEVDDYVDMLPPENKYRSYMNRTWIVGIVKRIDRLQVQVQYFEKYENKDQLHWFHYFDDGELAACGTHTFPSSLSKNSQESDEESKSFSGPSSPRGSHSPRDQQGARGSHSQRSQYQLDRSQSSECLPSHAMQQADLNRQRLFCQSEFDDLWNQVVRGSSKIASNELDRFVERFIHKIKDNTELIWEQRLPGCPTTQLNKLFREQVKSEKVEKKMRKNLRGGMYYQKEDICRCISDVTRRIEKYVLKLMRELEANNV